MKNDRHRGFALVTFIAYTLTWVWISCLLCLFVPSGFRATALPYLPLGLLCLALFFLLTHYLIDRSPRLTHWLTRRRNAGALLTILLTGLLGSTPFVLATVAQQYLIVLITVGQVLNGAALALGLALFHRLLIKFDLKRTATFAASTLSIAMLLTTALSLFAPIIIPVAIMSLPLLATGSLKLLNRIADLPKYEYEHLQELIGIPIRNNISSLLTGFSFGCFISINPGVLSSNLSLIAEISGIIILAAILPMSFSLINRNPNDAVFQIGLPILALSFLCLLLIPSTQIAFFIQLVGAAYTITVGISLSVYLIRDYRIALLTCLRPVGSIFLGFALGTGCDILMGLNIRTQLISITVFIILLASMLLLKDRRLKLGWVHLNVKAYDFSRDFFRYSCEILGREHYLTMREQEVFHLIANGRNRQSISRELHISEETTKSHMKNIYRKLNVHKQQEAMELVYRKAEDMATG